MIVIRTAKLSARCLVLSVALLGVIFGVAVFQAGVVTATGSGVQTPGEGLSSAQTATVTVTGDVVNENNEILEDAEIEVIDLQRNETVVTTTTAANGVYMVDLEAGKEYEIRATYDGQSGFARVDVVEGRTSNADIVIEGATPGEPAVFEIEDIDMNERISAGETLGVGVEIANTGGESGSQSLVIDAGPLGAANETVSLGVSDETVADFEFQTESSDVGTVTVTAASEDDSANRNVSVLSPADFDLEVLNLTEPVEGDPVEVTFSIENTGDSSGTASVDVSLEGVGTTTEDVTLDSAESTTETISVPTTDGDAGEYEVTVKSGDATDMQMATVRESRAGTGGPDSTGTSDSDDTEDGAAGPIDGFGPQTPLLLAGGAVLLLGGGYVFIRRDDESPDASSPERAGSTNSGWDEVKSENGGRETADTPGEKTGSVPQTTSSESGLTGTAGPPREIPGAPAKTFSYSDIERIEPLGKGGNADVYRAVVGDTELPVAVKEPRMSGTIHTDTVERLLEEAETWQRLDDHDHIVSVVEYGAEPLPWIAMEYMDDGDLGERAGTLPLDQALWTAIATTEAVRHAHRRGVAHLDLKPANILFRSVEDGWDVPKVADWGLSKHLLESSKSVEGLSPHYAAPEQFDDDYGTADDITDVYQLGAVFYELFTGEKPFSGEPFEVMHKIQNGDPTPPSEIADVPPTLDEILLTAMATEKQDRYETVIYLRDELRSLRE